ncbi:MAG: cell division protein FtsQ/DivIB [Candidatus Puniceispirillales bacterium]
MLKLINKEKNIIKTKFYKFETKKIMKIVYWSILLFILVLSSLYFFGKSNKNYLINQLKPLDQFLINNGFEIKNILISGTHNLSQDYLKNIINTQNHINILNVNLHSIYSKIIQNSWVEEIHVERILPDTIKIKVLEKKPIAIWQNHKGNKLITINGDVISHANVNKFKNSFPIIKGEKSKENISTILKILDTNKNFAKNIWSLTFINQRRWDLHFNQGLIVRLPSQDVIKAWQKIIKLQTNYNILNLRLTEIDLRNPKQILGKINFDKKVILRRKHL